MMCLTYISPSVETISGYTAEEIQHLQVEELMASKDYKKAMEYMSEGHRKFKLGKSVKRKAEFELKHKNGTNYWVEITAKFFKGENDRTQLFASCAIFPNSAPSKRNAMRLCRHWKNPSAIKKFSKLKMRCSGGCCPSVPDAKK